MGQNKVGVHAVVEDGEGHSDSEWEPEPSIMRTSMSGCVALRGEPQPKRTREGRAWMGGLSEVGRDFLRGERVK